MQQTYQKPVALSVAGFDPSGATGVLADLKTFAAHECYGVAAVTAIIAENTRETRKVAPVDSPLLRLQIQTLFEDVAAAGIKVGLLGNRKNMEVVAECLDGRGNVPIVADPNLRSWSGAEVVGEPELTLFKRLMFPRIALLTASAEEAGRLLSVPVATLEEMKGAAKLLQEQGIKDVVVTGGHLDRPADVYYDGQELEVFSGLRNAAADNGHGTGCTFSSAILANVVNGKTMRESIVLAKAYVNQAMARAYPIGGGRGPLNHLFRFAEPARGGTPVAELAADERR